MTPTSRTRERGTRTHSANGAVAAVAVTTGGGSLSRRRTSGAASPAASAVHATRRMAVGRRTARASIAPRRAERAFAGWALGTVAVAGGRRLAHERGDQRRARVGLRVPLDPEGEAALGIL